MRKLGVSRADLLESLERPALRALPAAEYEYAEWRLVRVGIPSKAAVGLIYFASASCGWLGVIIVYASPRTAYLLMGWLIVVALFLGWLLLRVKVESQ